MLSATHGSHHLSVSHRNDYKLTRTKTCLGNIVVVAQFGNRVDGPHGVSTYKMLGVAVLYVQTLPTLIRRDAQYSSSSANVTYIWAV